jgi:hypothetical protein
MSARLKGRLALMPVVGKEKETCQIGFGSRKMSKDEKDEIAQPNWRKNLREIWLWKLNLNHGLNIQTKLLKSFTKIGIQPMTQK